MTREELFDKLEPIVANQALTKDQRSDQIGQVMIEFSDAWGLLKGQVPIKPMLEVFNDWNYVMATIVDYYGLWIN